MTLGRRGFPLLALLALAAAASPMAGADEPPLDRAELWRRARLEKAQRARAESPPFLERTILSIEKAERPSLLDWNVAGFYPRFESIASGSRTAAGVRLWRPEIGGSPIDVHGSAFHSLRGYQLYELQVGLIPHTAGRFPLRSTKGDDVYEVAAWRPGVSRLTLYASGRYRDYPREAFYGLGACSRKEDRSSFRFRDTTLEAVGGYQLARRLAVQLRAGYATPAIRPGKEAGVAITQQRFDDASAPGLSEQPDFLHLTSLLLFDGRDEPGNPHKGALLAASLSRFDDRDSRAFAFHRLALDGRGYIPVGSRQRVLALRALVSRDEAGGGQRVPFYMQESLGGSHTLRGYQNFRFRGEKVLLLQAEYRWEAVPAVELALFVDGGQALRAGEGFDLGDLETDYGFGIRLKRNTGLIARLDVARSGEDRRVLLRFGPSF
jgi:hypothetical protein